MNNDNFMPMFSIEIEAGVAGQKGDKGDTGEQGIQGIQGIQGEQGIQGIQGVKGDPGNDGNGIASLEQTTTSHVSKGVNVWTLTDTNGETYEFNVMNGEAGVTEVIGTEELPIVLGDLDDGAYLLKGYYKSDIDNATVETPLDLVYVGTYIDRNMKVVVFYHTWYFYSNQIVPNEWHLTDSKAVASEEFVIQYAELKSRMVTEIAPETASNEKYPSAKAVYDSQYEQDLAINQMKDNLDGDISDLYGITDTQTENITTLQTDKEDKSNKVTSISSSSTDAQYPSAKLVYNQLALKEDKSNKVTSISSSSTDTQYPSAKCVYDSQTLQNTAISTLDTKVDETQTELDYYKTIYNVLPKVSGNGESITLDNTGESILKLDLSGQCKQNSTTGKNKFTFGAIENGTKNGVVRTIDGSKLTLNGTTTGANDTITTTDLGVELPAGTYSYTLIKNGTITLPSGGNTDFIVKDINDTQVFGGTFNSLNSSGTLTGTFTLSEATELYIQIYTNGANQVFNFDLFCQVESGSSATSYEPYTNGASPNPSYPQQIHEVSGDNTIRINNSNFFDGEIELGAFNNVTGVKVDSSNNVRSKNYCEVSPNTNYKIAKNNSTVGVVFYEYTKDKTFIRNQTVGSSYYLTTSSNCYYVMWRTYNTDSDLTAIYQINKGTSILPYTPYTKDTYEINLGVENLFDKSTLTFTNGNTTQFNETETGVEITSEGSGVFGVYILGNLSDYLNKYVTFSMSTTPSAKIKDTAFIVCNSDGSSRTTIGNTIGSNSQTLTTLITGTYTQTKLAVRLYFADGTAGEKINFNNVQVQVGTKVNSYTPYGTTPIKMRGIGTYEDYFTKNSGKQLFDKSNLQAKNVYINDTTMKFASSNATKTLYIPCEPSTTYTISKVVSSRFYVGSSVNVPSNGGDVSVQVHNNSATSLTITTGANDNYLSVFYYKSDSDTLTEQAILNSIMINEGTTALPYEPYGTGQWCKYNAIGKSVLNESSGWELNGNTDNIYRYWVRNTNFFNALPNIIEGAEGTFDNKILTNYFTYSDYNVAHWGCFSIANRLSANWLLFFSEETSLTNFNNWISSHNIIVYYPLATPYLSLIEDTTLISQLDKVEKALGKDGQTNISQVNNDAPFKIYASALMKISGE